MFSNRFFGQNWLKNNVSLPQKITVDGTNFCANHQMMRIHIVAGFHTSSSNQSYTMKLVCLSWVATLCGPVDLDMYVSILTSQSFKIVVWKTSCWKLKKELVLTLATMGSQRLLIFLMRVPLRWFLQKRAHMRHKTCNKHFKNLSCLGHNFRHGVTFYNDYCYCTNTACNRKWGASFWCSIWKYEHLGKLLESHLLYQAARIKIIVHLYFIYYNVHVQLEKKHFLNYNCECNCTSNIKLSLLQLSCI